ncbi:sterol desaturase family protein [Erwinia persicina]|uniref:sterol desaturase family protein n=1 Tax=Erwinia persicina TaxID=55211 RepID=UPI001653F5EF|nr:sterol desaturase family protein [Erwinia persicina]MBC3945371.1 sterol desaturase family protein [Erwinia persicina]
MSELVLPIVAMVLLVMGEALVLHRQDRQQVQWHDVVFNLNSGHIMLWLFRGLEVTCYGYVALHFSQHWLDALPTWGLWLFALLAWDFAFYWLHRLHHRFSLLWAVHVVHHQGEHFNLSLGVRNSWYSSLTSIPFFLLLAVAGVPLSVFVTVSIFHYTVQLFNHNALTPKLGWLESVLVTPNHHRVHHVCDHAYSDKNFGGSFIFWDKLFGTFARLPETEYRFGTAGERASQNPFWASNRPLFRLLKLPFSPVNGAATFHCRARALISGMLLLFVLVASYVWIYGYGYQNISGEQVTLFMLLALGAVALGGLSEGRRWSPLLWLTVGVACPFWFALCRETVEPWLFAAMLVALHSMVLALGWGRQALQAEVKHG